MDWAALPLLGIDVGFSRCRRTTGMAWSADGKVGAIKTHSDWERRRNNLPAIPRFAVIAIDGPLLPDGTDERAERSCERFFIRGVFQKRCKPGLSHFGSGFTLRRAARDTAEQFRHLAASGSSTGGPHVISDLPIVEAFPNAFIAVLLSDGAFSVGQAIKRKKFDWLYGHALRERAFHRLTRYLQWKCDALLTWLEAECDHEKRAALICLLTAGCAAAGHAMVIGNEAGGYFWLPPRELWANWALDALPLGAALSLQCEGSTGRG
jgi:hypothetical protein